MKHVACVDGINDLQKKKKKNAVEEEVNTHSLSALQKWVGIDSVKKPYRSSNQFSDFTGKEKRGPEVVE